MIEWRATLGRTKDTLSNFTPFLRPRRAGLLLALVLLLLETAMSLAQPWPLALTLDYVLNDRRELPGFWPESLSGEALLLAGIAFLLVSTFFPFCSTTTACATPPPRTAVCCG